MCFNSWFCFVILDSYRYFRFYSIFPSEIKTCKSIIKKKKENHSIMVLLTTTKLKTESLVSKVTVDTGISPYEFVSLNDVL